MRCGLALAATVTTDEASLAAAADAAGPSLLGPPTTHERCDAAVGAALTTALEFVDEAARASTHVLLEASDYARWTARRYALRCQHPRRRLRPSDSLGLEAAALLRPLAASPSWDGSCHLVTDVRPGVVPLLLEAEAGVVTLLCEVLADPAGPASAANGDPDDLAEPAWIVVAGRPAPGTTPSARPRTGVAHRSLLLAAGRAGRPTDGAAT